MTAFVAVSNFWELTFCSSKCRDHSQATLRLWLLGRAGRVKDVMCLDGLKLA